jgi:uncharacterized coiled-coil DUF342 family protein
MMKRIGELNAEVTNLKAEADRFKAEVNALQAQIKRMAMESIHDLGQLGEYSAENKLLRKELADAQENYHLVNEMVAKLIKESKPSV